mgnify:FL=1
MLTAKLIKIANELDRRRLIREADYLDRIIRLAQSKGSRSDLKILLKKVLENHGYTVSDNPGEADLHLNTQSNSWGKLDDAWFKFAKHVLQIEEVATDWKTAAPKIGSGYKPTIGGMIDLLQDFVQGGRAQVGANLGTLGEGGLADQTDALKESIDDQRELNTALESFTAPNPEEDTPLNRSREFRETREELEEEARKRRRRKRSEDDLIAKDTGNLPPESEASALTGPDESAEGVYTWGSWNQRRNSQGLVTGYKRVESPNWQESNLFETRRLDGRMKTQPVSPEQKTFILGLGTIGERVVANIGHPALPQNSWKKN